MYTFTNQDYYVLLRLLLFVDMYHCVSMTAVVLIRLCHMIYVTFDQLHPLSNRQGQTEIIVLGGCCVHAELLQPQMGKCISRMLNSICYLKII